MAKYVSALTGPEMDAALMDMAQHNSEAWAVGERNGEAVSSADVTYHNNAAYYSNNAMSAAARAEAAVPPGTAGALFFDRAQTLTDGEKEQVYKNIGASMSNPNLCDNGWFRVNQRETASVSVTGTSSKFVVDRWKAVQYMDATVAADHVTFTSRAANSGTFGQNYPEGTFKVGDIYIISVNVGGTIYSRAKTFTVNSSPYSTITGSGLAVSFFNYPGHEDRIRFRPAGTSPLDIYAVKIEKGFVSTLALDEAPNMATELLKCYQYLYVVGARGTNSQVTTAFLRTGTDWRVIIPLPVKMFAAPTASMTDVANLALYDGANSQPCSSMSVSNAVTFNTISLNLVCPTITGREVAGLNIRNSDKLIISAEI